MLILKSGITWNYLLVYIYDVVICSLLVDVLLWRLKDNTYRWIKKYYNVQDVKPVTFQVFEPSVHKALIASKKDNTLISTIISSTANVLIAAVFENFTNNLIYLMGFRFTEVVIWIISFCIYYKYRN